MHFAYAPRKSPHPPPYAIRTPRSHLFRHAKIRVVALVLLALFGLSYVFSHTSANTELPPPPGTPYVVLVTVFGPADTPARRRLIRENREAYATRHGYATFFPEASDYNFGDQPLSWAKVPAMRHAMTKHPHSTFFWHLSTKALIMNQTLSIQRHVTDSERLESLMLLKHSVVPPDSVILTFNHVKGENLDFIITHDKVGISQDSFIIRSGEWAKFFLDSWFDPLYRSYGFQKAEAHALEHIVQWHPTVLAKLAILPSRILNSHVRQSESTMEGALYQKGDFVTTFAVCGSDSQSCEEEMTPFAKQAILQT